MRPRQPKPNGQPFGLTRQELIIIRLLCEGLSNGEIGARLNISYDTVKRHVYNLCRKLGVNSRLEVAMIAVSQQLAIAAASPTHSDRNKLVEELERVHGRIEMYVRRSRLLVQKLAVSPDVQER